MEIEVLGLDGSVKKKIKVDDRIFGLEYNNDLVYKALIVELSNARQGTASTKTRGEVSGGGRKPWRQKGTGRARHGSIRSPIWVGGGIAHGPKPRDYSMSIPKAMKRKAYFTILSAKTRDKDLLVVEDFSLDRIKTKDFVSKFSKILARLTGGYGLLILPSHDKNIHLSSRNLPNLKVLPYNQLNIKDLFYSNKVFFLESAIKKYEEMYLQKV
ncbi:MAG: 50S ribosomal protein L4 [Spirochaetia bacterium]|nr:50S ribosomal protein L4 [Spirochaetota bacterium]MCX8096919.1 50S ribosomal protein L4 [Spirochaetota bacterium]MDW8112440.1 50S ribosomal protein L4 [Spirochaetia bacterium]